MTITFWHDVKVVILMHIWLWSFSACTQIIVKNHKLIYLLCGYVYLFLSFCQKPRSKIHNDTSIFVCAPSLHDFDILHGIETFDNTEYIHYYARDHLLHDACQHEPEHWCHIHKRYIQRDACEIPVPMYVRINGE